MKRNLSLLIIFCFITSTTLADATRVMSSEQVRDSLTNAEKVPSAVQPDERTSNSRSNNSSSSKSSSSGNRTSSSSSRNGSSNSSSSSSGSDSSSGGGFSSIFQAIINALLSIFGGGNTTNFSNGSGNSIVNGVIRGLANNAGGSNGLNSNSPISTVNSNLLGNSGDIYNAARLSVGMDTSSGPDGGNLACAWAINRVLLKTGKKIGSGNINSTTEMQQELENMVKNNQGVVRVAVENAPPGAIIISPTVGSNVGHVGIVGENGTVYSNSSSSKRFAQNYTVNSWVNRYTKQKGLQTYAYVML
jgi:hypothetical protein